jgi:hypothetical protein
MSKALNSGEAPKLFPCSYFTGTPEFHVLETVRTPFIAVAVPCRLGGHLILSGSHVGWNDASPVLSEAQVPASVPLLTSTDQLGDTGAPPAP